VSLDFGEFLEEESEESSETDIQFNNQWGLDQVYDIIDEDTDNGENNIGFKSGRSVNFPVGGTYTFTITSDDGVRLWIDGNPISLSGDHFSWAEKGAGDGVYMAKDIALDVGFHDFILEWYEGGGEAYISFSYDAVECTQDSDCTEAGKNTCDLSINTCVSVDSVAPTSRIMSIIPDESVIGYRTEGAVKHAILGAANDGWTLEKYFLFVGDEDNDGNTAVSTLASCFVEINGTSKSRDCNDWTSFTVGRSITGADCTADGDDVCRVRVGAVSETGIETGIVNLSRDVTSNEEEYPQKNFNEIIFGVDWSPPIGR